MQGVTAAQKTKNVKMYLEKARQMVAVLYLKIGSYE